MSALKDWQNTPAAASPAFTSLSRTCQRAQHESGRMKDRLEGEG
jgi:hypothetical protein